MILRIGNDGRVRGLWTDDIDWPALGRVSVRRASHVEFDARRGLWTVQEHTPRCRLRRMAQRLLGRPMGNILFRAHRREEALCWERAWFGPGGVGWNHQASPEEGGGWVSNLDSIWSWLTGWLRPSQHVRDHRRRQAFGPRWSQHRPRRIRRYTRRRARRNGRWV